MPRLGVRSSSAPLILSRVPGHPWPRCGLAAFRVATGLGAFDMASETTAGVTMVGDPSTDLMIRVRDGDAAAFEQLAGLWQGRLVTLFLHHTGDHATAEDLAQEVFLRVYRARASYQPTAKFTTWIHTIANNVASDLRQRSYRCLLYTSPSPRDS